MRRDDATRDAPTDNGVPMSRDPTSHFNIRPSRRKFDIMTRPFIA